MQGRTLMSDAMISKYKSNDFVVKQEKNEDFCRIRENTGFTNRRNPCKFSCFIVNGEKTMVFSPFFVMSKYQKILRQFAEYSINLLENSKNQTRFSTNHRKLY